MFKNRIILFSAIFLILSLICFFSFVVVYGNDEGQNVSNIILIIATFFFYLFSFPLLLIFKLLDLHILANLLYIYLFLFDILFYTIIIYKLILWKQNKRKAKEE